MKNEKKKVKSKEEDKAEREKKEDPGDAVQMELPL